MSVLEQPALRTQAFIGGTFVDAAAGATFATEDPATGRVLADVAACDATDVDRAVAAARRVFDAGTWSRIAPAERKAVMLRLCELIEANAEELAVLDCLEAGKPIADCRAIDVPETLTTFRWYAELADKLYDEVAPTGPGALGLILREPIGVVGAVIPWNFPLIMFAWKVAPALVAGNSVLVKPAEQTSLSALRMAELAAEAGVPDGVLNVLPGFGPEVGEPIGRHLGIDAVTFTGSTEVGRRFLRYAADSNLKEVALECGGKSPQIVMAGVRDLEHVAVEVLGAAMWNMGENCSCGSRLLVQRGVHDALLERLAALTPGWVVGDPRDEATQIGPLIEAAHLERVEGYVARGVAEGASLVVGGTRALPGSGGHFMAPTIFAGVSNDMTIAREEIFGPVLAVIPFEDEAEAIRLANDNAYGLAASLYTDDLDTAIRVGRSLQAGVVAVNGYSEGDVTTPFGGWKQSGFGGRDKGVHALAQYTELKTLWIAVR